MLLPILLSLSINTYDTIPFKIKSGWELSKPFTSISMGGDLRKYFRFEDSLENSIEVDSIFFKIKGDTLTAINGLFKMFWKETENRGSEKEDWKKDLQVAVDYINKLPELYKQGRYWNAYQKMVKKRGYKVKTLYPQIPKNISKKL